MDADEALRYVGQSEANDNLRPYSFSDIDERVRLRNTPHRGRCLFSRHDLAPGDVVFCEAPLFSITTDLDPDLYQRVTNALAEVPEDEPQLGPPWHFATLWSLRNGSGLEIARVMDKYHPPVDKKKTPLDVVAVMDAEGGDLDRYNYESALMAWRYNCFGHHSDSQGVVMYHRASMLSHSCNPNVTWHYGPNEEFVVKAMKQIKRGEELSISYIGEVELLKSTKHRRNWLSSWEFKCECGLCMSKGDGARGLRCPDCGVGSVFLTEVEAGEELVLYSDGNGSADQLLFPDSIGGLSSVGRAGNGEVFRCIVGKASEQTTDFNIHEEQSLEDGAMTYTVASPCCVCHAKLQLFDEFLSMERLYWERLDECSVRDIPDLENVVSEARRVFTDHWILNEYNVALYNCYREMASTAKTCEEALPPLRAAIEFMRQRITYFSSRLRNPNYTYACALEELGDLVLLERRYAELPKDKVENLWEVLEQDWSVPHMPALTLFERNYVSRLYETAMNTLIACRGERNEYTSMLKWKCDLVAGATPCDQKRLENFKDGPGKAKGRRGSSRQEDKKVDCEQVTADKKDHSKRRSRSVDRNRK